MPHDLLWLNGSISPIEEARISLEDRGNTFADGIYEVVLFYDGKPFMLAEHLERWEYSARGIMLESPGTRQERARRLCDLVQTSGHRDALGQETHLPIIRHGLARRATTAAD